MAAAFVLIFTSPAALLEVPTSYPTIQAAIDAAQAGDTVYVRAGTYDETLSLKRPTTIEGEGRDRVVVRRPAADGPVLSIASCPDGTVRGISFESTDRPAEDDPEAEPGAVVEITESSVEVFDCEVRNGPGSGIRIRGKSTCRILACVATENLRVGFVSHGENAKVTFVGNTSLGNRSGIAFTQGGGGTAKINRCQENMVYGIAVAGKGNPVLFSNTCSGNGSTGVFCEADSAMYALGNHCFDNKGSGIVLGSKSEALVNFNTLENNEKYGLWSARGAHMRLKANVFQGNGEFGNTEAYSLFHDGRFAQIEEIAARFRRDKSKSYHGEWQLPNVYDGISDRCQYMTKAQERTFMVRLQEWKKAYPNSLACAITEADAYCEFAWRERGSGWASTVTAQGWKGFRDYLDKALMTIEAAEKLPERDPHLFLVKCTVMLGLSRTSFKTPPILSVLEWWTNTKIDIPSPAEQAFLQGVAVEPTYYPLYYARVVPLMPRWGGSPSEMVKHAEWSAQRTAASEGESLYARIACKTLRSDGRENYLNNYRFSWKRIRQGYRDILQRFPDSKTRLNSFCLMACLHNDRKTAAELFAQIGDDWQGDVWDDEADFQHWRTWAK
jgi:parallel beta-helix repeat protein